MCDKSLFNYFLKRTLLLCNCNTNLLILLTLFCLGRFP